MTWGVNVIYTFSSHVAGGYFTLKATVLDTSYVIGVLAVEVGVETDNHVEKFEGCGGGFIKESVNFSSVLKHADLEHVSYQDNHSSEKNH